MDLLDAGRSTSTNQPDTTPPSSTTETLTEHLSYPAQSELDAAPVASTSSSAQARPVLKDRLYVGNLPPSVNEYTLLKVFSKYGKISKLDFLFHKSGPQKGKPRGYAFVEYFNKDDADKALGAHDKLLRGRKLVVTYANQAPIDPTSGALSKNRRGMSEVGKPTTLSLLKSAGAARSTATDAKIARMEAKLQQLEGAAASGAVPSLKGHPSLPPKPVAAAAVAIEASRDAPSASTSGIAASGSGSKARRRAPPLPALPIAPPKQPPSIRPERDPYTAISNAPPGRAAPKKNALKGVKMVKPKNES